MSEINDRYRKLAAEFSDRVRAVPADAWDNPAPCDGWVARDVVRHLVEWVPGFFGASGVTIASGPSVDDDPVAAWEALDASLRSNLDAPDVAGRELDTAAGRHTFENAIDMFVTPDVLVHTWDLARATGLDESLDVDEVRRMLVNMEPMDEVLRNSGHFGPRVEVADDADDQTKLIAFTGRQP
ncbi:MAG TPA: TIGR03086 family metal-binding protein [Acidimicrobiales bacterium]|nr:TIGR03086 family metal-binding protein [Acidimicrobiales bacterium]